jgi:enhancing lycopene biosynthesis protein 2
MNEIPPEARQEGSAVLGSLVALLFMGDTIWPRKVLYFLGGWAMSKLFGESVQGVIGTSLETARALTAMFGLAIVEKAFDVISNFDSKRVAQSITDAIDRRFRD